MLIPVVPYDVYDMKVMVIEHMPENNFLGIETFFGCLMQAVFLAKNRSGKE